MRKDLTYKEEKGWFTVDKGFTVNKVYLKKLVSVHTLATKDFALEMIWCMNESASSKMVSSTIWIPFLNEGFGRSLKEHGISFHSFSPILEKAFLSISSLHNCEVNVWFWWIVMKLQN